MKIYLNLLSLTWGICCWMPLAVAETPKLENVQTHQEATTEIIESATESSTETPSETSEKATEIVEKTPQQELEAAFPGCPVVASDIPVVEVSTITPSAPEENNPELLTDNPQEKSATTDSEPAANDSPSNTFRVTKDCGHLMSTADNS